MSNFNIQASIESTSGKINNLTLGFIYVIIFTYQGDNRI
jgi:hypothetical protein